MRNKPLALASACLLALSVTAAHAGLDFDDARPTVATPLTLSAPLPAADILAGHGLMSFDQIKTRVSLEGATFVAQGDTGTASDVTAKAAVAQLGTDRDPFNYSSVGVLLVLIAGGFMWLSLLRQRREN